MAPSQPGWYCHFLTDISEPVLLDRHAEGLDAGRRRARHRAAPLLARRAGPWLLAGAVFAFVMWMSAQGLFGNVFTGSDTDPNTGPLVILLAAAMVPTVVAAPGRGTGARRPPSPVRRVPALATILVVGIGAALALAATYPRAGAGVGRQRHGGHGDGGFLGGGGRVQPGGRRPRATPTRSG